MTVYGRWGMIRVPNQGNWRELVKRTLCLKSDSWDPKERSEGKFQVEEETKKTPDETKTPTTEEDSVEEELKEEIGTLKTELYSTPRMILQFRGQEVVLRNEDRWREQTERILALQNHKWTVDKPSPMWEQGIFGLKIQVEVTYQDESRWITTTGEDLRERIQKEFGLPTSEWPLWRGYRKIKRKEEGRPGWYSLQRGMRKPQKWWCWMDKVEVRFDECPTPEDIIAKFGANQFWDNRSKKVYSAAELEEGRGYQRYQEPQALITFRGEEKWFNFRSQTFQTEISEWAGVQIKSYHFRETGTGEITNWRRVENNHNYEVEEYPIISVQVSFPNGKTIKAVVNKEADLGKQWYGIARMNEVQGRIRAIREGQEIQLEEIRNHDQISIEEAWDTKIIVQDETTETEFKLWKADSGTNKWKIQKVFPGRLLFSQNQKVDWSDIQDGETYQAFEPMKFTPEIVGHFIWGSSGAATLKYRTSREAQALIRAKAGPNRIIHEEGSGELTDPMKVQADRTYELVYKEIPDSIKFWWDDNLYEFPRKPTNAEFWNQVRESINARSLQLWGRSGIVQPNYANSKETYILRRWSQKRAIIEVTLRRNQMEMLLDINQPGIQDKIKQTFGNREWIPVDGEGNRCNFNKLKDGRTYQLRMENEMKEPFLKHENTSRFTLKNGRKWIHCKVEIDQKIHEIAVKEGGRHNFIQVLTSIGGGRYYEIQNLKPEVSWENQILKISSTVLAAYFRMVV
jgi:hypothetical protein